MKGASLLLVRGARKETLEAVESVSGVYREFVVFHSLLSELLVLDSSVFHHFKTPCLLKVSLPS